jgi:hypothetical protein
VEQKRKLVSREISTVDVVDERCYGQQGDVDPTALQHGKLSRCVRLSHCSSPNSHGHAAPPGGAVREQPDRYFQSPESRRCAATVSGGSCPHSSLSNIRALDVAEDRHNPT